MMDIKEREEYEKQILIEKLAKMPARVVSTAFLHATQYDLYGVDVTEKWQTAVENKANLERAYLRWRRDQESRLIRCKDCKHFDPIYTHREGVCGHWNAKTENNAYCAYAERRTDG